MIIRVPEDGGKLYERIQYPAGELQVRLRKSTLEALYKSSSVQVVCREAHLHLMELALLADALHHEVGHLESTLVLPYLPYGRADRRFVDGDCHGLKVFGEVIDGMHFSKVRTLDVHSFRAGKHIARLEDISARPFIAKAIADICDHGGHPVVLLPDEGAKRYGLDGALQCHKRRDPATGKLSGFEVPTFEQKAGTALLIVDDICDGGGTFIGLAQEIQKHRGAENTAKLYLYVTHGIFSKGLQPLLRHFEAIYTTNSLPSQVTEKESACYIGGRLNVFNCEPELLGEKDAKSK